MAEDKTSIARMGLRENWLSLVEEEILDPDLEIVDPHHHLWDRDGQVYEADQLLTDAKSGHRIVQTVYIECRSGYDEHVPEHLQPVGETKYVLAQAQRLAGKPEAPHIAGIVAHADLYGAHLDEVLDAHEEAGKGLLRGIRQAGARDSHPDALVIPGRGRKGQYLDSNFQRGVARLGERGLTYDTWHYHHQSGDFLELARAVPGTTLVLDHCATPLGVGRFAGKRAEIFGPWQDQMARLAEEPNVVAKLGGLAMPDNGWAWHEREQPPSSEEFAEAYAPWYRHMIDCFGPERCMFESNFPVDRASVSYNVPWNAFKKIAADYSGAAKADLFAGTARRVYRL